MLDETMVLKAICQLMTDSKRDCTPKELSSAISGLAGQYDMENLCTILHGLRSASVIQTIKGGMADSTGLVTPHNFNEWTFRITDTGKRKCATIAPATPAT